MSGSPLGPTHQYIHDQGAKIVKAPKQCLFLKSQEARLYEYFLADSLLCIFFWQYLLNIVIVNILSLVLPLTACCLSPLPGFESRPGYVRKLPVTWGKVVVFAGYSGFLHYVQLASHELATIGINVTKFQIQIYFLAQASDSELPIEYSCDSISVFG